MWLNDPLFYLLPFPPLVHTCNSPLWPMAPSGCFVMSWMCLLSSMVELQQETTCWKRPRSPTSSTAGVVARRARRLAVINNCPPPSQTSTTPKITLTTQRERGREKWRPAPTRSLRRWCNKLRWLEHNTATKRGSVMQWCWSATQRLELSETGGMMMGSRSGGSRLWKRWRWDEMVARCTEGGIKAKTRGGA